MNELLILMGVEPRRPWPYIPKDDISRRVADDVPFAGVDDQELERGRHGRAWLDARPGPTLAIQPATPVGMSREMIDMLLRFALDPGQAEFDDRTLRVFHDDEDVRWTSGSLDEPEFSPVPKRGGR